MSSPRTEGSFRRLDTSRAKVGYAGASLFTEIDFKCVKLDIARSRVGIWEKFEIRRHTLRKVYVNERDGLDLFIVGTVVIKPHGEEQTVLEFVARAVVRSTAEGPRICYYQPVMPNPSAQPILAHVDV